MRVLYASSYNRKYVHINYLKILHYTRRNLIIYFIFLSKRYQIKKIWTENCDYLFVNY